MNGEMKKGTSSEVSRRVPSSQISVPEELGGGHRPLCTWMYFFINLEAL